MGARGQGPRYGAPTFRLPYLSMGKLVPRPSDLFLSAPGRACPAPTPRPCRGEAGLAPAPHAPRGRGRNHAITALEHAPPRWGMLELALLDGLVERGAGRSPAQ